MNDPGSTQADEPAGPQNVEEPSEATASPRADLHDSIGWIILGVAVAIASWRMDRLTDRHINPLTVPGLVPGLLGGGMVIVGTIFGVRSWLRGGHRQPATAPDANQRQRGKRALLAMILCCGYSIVLIGHGLPFWLASSIYVTCSILVFNRISPDPALRRIDLAAIVKALLIAVICSVAVWLVFERLFLVRLP
jgi:hypothetical protein